MAEDQTVAAVEIINVETGHRYLVFPNGRVEGFGADTVVINRIPLLEMRAAEEALGHG